MFHLLCVCTMKTMDSQRHILPPLGGFPPAPETRESDLEESHAVCVA